MYSFHLIDPIVDSYKSSMVEDFPFLIFLVFLVLLATVVLEFFLY